MSAVKRFNDDDIQVDKLDLHFNMELSKIGMKQELSRKRKRNSSRQVVVACCQLNPMG